MKTTAEIKELIFLFYEGKTNPEQEKELKAYFEQDNIAEELKDEQIIFKAIFKKNAIEIPIQLKNRLLTTIDDLEAKQNVKTTVFSNPKKWIGLAASAVLILGLSLFLKTDFRDNEKQNLSQTDLEKIHQAQEAILLISQKYNQGLDQLSYSQKTVAYTNQILEKSINNLNQ